MVQPRLFEWDDGKAEANLAKHGMPFDYATAVFLDPAGIDFDASHHNDREVRHKFVGRIDGRIFTVVYTQRGATIRLISARRANAQEERRYGQVCS